MRAKTVLLVDDHPDPLEVIKFWLVRERFSVLTAEDGAEALEVLNTQAPDVLVTDLAMPEVNGLGLIREVRASPSLAGLPIIVLSAPGQALPEVPRAQGATEDMHKPVVGDEQAAEISKLG
jgi:CheY-like chemotaxis protein